MAHFAKLDDDNKVIEVNVINNFAINSNNEEQSGIEFLTNWSGGYSNWKQTSYNNRIRFNYAGIGYTYDEVRDGFIPPKCHDEAVVNDKCLWDCTNADHTLAL
jgi:hypothetical protein